MIRGRALRSGISKLTSRRFVSTANNQTVYTTLGNGITVASETNPSANSATVGLWFGAGSRSEHTYSNGISALTSKALARGSGNGLLLSSENGKETNGLLVQTTNENIDAAAQKLAEIVKNSSSLVSDNFDAAKAEVIAEADALEATPSKMVLEHLNASAFQGYSLGLPTLGTSEIVTDLQVQDSIRLLEKHLVGPNVVIAASGNFDHNKLVDALESAGLQLPNGLKPAIKPASFLGSEVRMRDDTMPKAYVSIAAEGEGVNSPAYYVAKVASAIFGDFDHSKTQSLLSSPKLASIVQEYNIVDKYTHFSNSYSDTGLWGFNAEVSNIERLDEFVHFTLKEWNRLSISITDAEVARGKAAVKTALLRELDSTKATASDIANKVLLVGYRKSLTEAFQNIDAITTKDVKAWANTALWDRDIVISGTGQIEALLDYNRWRNEMAMMRW